MEDTYCPYCGEDLVKVGIYREVVALANGEYWISEYADLFKKDYEDAEIEFDIFTGHFAGELKCGECESPLDSPPIFAFLKEIERRKEKENT